MAAIFMNELPRKEIVRGRVCREPIAMQKKVVHLIWKDQLLDFYALFSQIFRELYRLTERDVAIIIALNEQHRRPPRILVRHRR